MRKTVDVVDTSLFCVDKQAVLEGWWLVLEDLDQAMADVVSITCGRSVLASILVYQSAEHLYRYPSCYHWSNMVIYYCLAIPSHCVHLEILNLSALKGKCDLVCEYLWFKRACVC